MRILYFSRTLTGHDRRFLTKLGESGHDIRFLALEAALNIPDALPANVHPVPALGVPSGSEDVRPYVAAFQAVLRDLAPDLVHAGPVHSAGYLSALAGAHPLLLQSWGYDILESREGSDAGVRFALHHADALFCDCDAVRLKVQNLGGPTGDDVVQFPWGVDLNRFSPGPAADLRQSLGWHDKFIVLSTRSWERHYGIDVLLESWRLTTRREPRLRLILAAGGSLAAQVQAQIAAAAMETTVHCPGNIDHSRLPQYFRAADLYVSCSYVDGSSVSLLEAMATGIPVLVSDVPGNREWVAPGTNGWFGVPGDAASFATGILRAAAASAREREEMGKANRAVAECRADWHSNFPKLLAMYGLLAAKSQT